MEHRFIKYYEQELKHVRETARDFSESFPKIAGRLGLENLEVSDPYVERLIESFAFLSARTQLKIDANFPHFTQQLLQVVYPNFQSQTPSALIAKFFPDSNEPGLSEGYLIPRSSYIKSAMVSRGDPVCEYNCIYDVTLWPVKLDNASYIGNASKIEEDGWDLRSIGAKSAIKISLSTLAGLTFDGISLDKLPIYIDGVDDIPSSIYEHIFANSIGFLVRSKNSADSSVISFDRDCITTVGFEDEENLLPATGRNLNSYRLLQEYFMLPEKFSFLRLSDLQHFFSTCSGSEIEILILMENAEGKLESQIGKENFLLYCSPAINLVEKNIDRVNISPFEHEYEVIADKTKPLNYEIYSIKSMVGYSAANKEEITLQPLYGQYDHPVDKQSGGYYSIRQEQRLLSQRQKKNGHRSSYLGSATYISLTCESDFIDSGKIKQVGMRALCTNRDLPLLMSLGRGVTDFTIDAGAPLEKIRSVSVPTKPLPSVPADKTSWLLIGLLSLNMQSLIGPNVANTLSQSSSATQHTQDAVALRELFRLMANCFGDQFQQTAEAQIDSVLSMAVKPVVRQILLDGHITVARGLRISLLCSENGFEGRSAFLLGTVCSHFFSRYVSINTFTEFELSSQQRGVIHRWPARIGDKQLL